MSIWGGEGRDLVLFFHTHAVNPESGELEDKGTMFRADAVTGKAIDRHDGFVWDEPAAWEDSALRRFLVDLHVQLYLPSPWGLILTGILGLMMMAAVVSGVLMHRHVIRDLFVAERHGGRLVGARDRHALASSWSIPFAFLLAFTGSFYSFAGTVGFPIVASVAFGGDEEAMSETMFEPPVPENATPSTLGNLNAMVSDSVARAGSEATFVEIAHFGRADARVTVWHDPGDGGMLYPVNRYDGRTGIWLGAPDPLGTAPSVGGTLYGLMAPLHFGHFAGLLSKVVWGALGVVVPEERRYGTLAQRLLATLCLLLPVLRLASGGMDWATALLHGQTDIVTVDLLLLVAGASLWWFAWPTRSVLRLLIEPAE